MDLQTQIGTQSFTNCLMNASGAKCRTEEELNALVAGSNSSFVTKSATLTRREGNPTPRYVEVPLGSINSMGLPNEGLETYLNFVQTHAHEKKAFLSLAGLSLEENLEMLQIIGNSDFEDFVELNLSCPNIPGKPQTGYDFERTHEVLEEVFKIYSKPLGVKLPPYFDMVHFERIANILNGFPIQFVTCINSIGNALFIDTEKESVVIKPKEGFGGIGGAYVKPTALANVRQLYMRLRKDIAVMGCGGVENGEDVFQHILCGASMVQVGTQLMREGTPVFDRLQTELQSLMESKGYNNISDFKGKLQSL